MARHDLGPGWIVLKYTSNAHAHKAILPCTFDGAPSPGLEPDLQKRVGGSIAATAAVSAYCNVAKVFLKTTDTFTAYEVYYKPTPTSATVFIYSATLSVAGTSGGARAACGESVITFKTPEAGGLKLYLMEGSWTENVKTPLPVATGDPVRDYTDYITGDDDWIVGRNNNFPLVPLFWTTKLNDHLRRKYLL